MSGKAYTMREMKMIVEYLTEHRAYGELKGRKMWMDFASSNLTTRTWQSLKETFLKRILPDITNPYYKLTVQQIASFQQGTDIDAKINNKLEIRTVDENSNSSDSHNKDPQPSKPSNSKGVDVSGEPNSTKVNQNRSSTDTAISEPCYKTADDIRKDLESPQAKRCGDSPTKSIRDYITYSEPLTPMLQEVLDDFGSDDEGDEPQMQIVEYPETNIRNDNLSPIEILDTENTECENEKNDNVENNTKKETVHEGDSKIRNRSEQDVLQDNIETECIDISDDAPSSNVSENQVNNITGKDDVVSDNRENNIENSVPNQSDNQESQVQSNSTATMLPNNQEAFKKLCSNDENSLNVPTSEQPPDLKNSNTRKRSQSQDIQKERPKKRRSVDKVVAQSLSDGDTRTQKEHNVLTTSKLSPVKNKTTLPTVKKVSSENEKKNNNSVKTTNGDNENLLKNNETLHSNSGNQGSSDESVNKRPKRRKKVSVLKDIEEDKTVSSEVELIQKDKEESSKETNSPNYIKEDVVINDVVVLKSQSETSSDNVVPPKKKKPAVRASHKIYRDKALANVFGFSAGISTKRQKQIKHRKRHHSQQQTIINTSGSSEWTSDSGSEYVSPPRGRKNKQTRKYLKPKPARILSLEEEGGLFVMYGKKIYPVVKDGKIIKNYLTYTPENDSEDEESYWKLKYIEEKKKTNELTKLLKNNDKRDIVPVESSDANVSKPISLERSSTSTDPSKESEKNVEVNNKVAEKTKEETSESKTLKIKFTKNNEEVQLEGIWSHIHPVLQSVVEILHKEPANEKPVPDNQTKERESNVQHTTESPNKMTQKQKTARESTSTDVDIGVVRDKINKLEEEIFKEIEEREKSDSMHEDVPVPNNNITKRRTLKQKKSTSAPVTPTKRRKLSNEDRKSNGALEKRKTLNVENNASIVTRQQSRTPKKILNDKEENEKVISNAKKTRKSTKNVVQEEEDDSEIKYKFPSPPKPQPASAKKLNKSSPKVNTNTRSKRSTDKDTKIFSSPENLSCNSIESTQGYQDSDASTLSMCIRKKRKFSITSLNRAKSKTQRSFRRKTRAYVSEDLSSDSSRSFVTAPLKSSSHQNSSSNTEIYRSESYQMLFPQKKQSIKPLEIIAETSPTINNIDRLNNNEYDGSNFAENSLNHMNDIKLSPAFDNDGENSSNVTLPPSPVLSIVENISISRNALNNSNDMPIDNTTEEGKQTMLNDYMFEDVDMSVPLMEQECGLEKSCDNPSECHYNMNVSKPTQQISESFLNKICAVNIKEPTLSESINLKLRNLLLESAKKIANHIQGNNNNTENKMDLSEPNKQQKTRSKKRCSTPRKRQKKQNLNVASTEQLVIHEHTESFGSKISNPQPVVVVTSAIEDNNILSADVGMKGSLDKTKTRKKKDVIKVKIVKPRPKKKMQGSDDTLQIIGKTSLQADSGNNDTESGVFLQGCDDSIDLIHNHSDTCLHAHECVGDSVEIIENNVSSVISLNSNSAPLKELKSSKSMVNITENVLLDTFCENAQDGDSTVTEPQRTSGTTLNSSDANISAMNSLLTEDLSDESVETQKRASKWYLLSEDETNTNYVDFGLQTPSSNEGCGANLHQIFPITCAVPDLSTITEENTAKFTVDRNTKSDIDSQSLSG